MTSAGSPGTPDPLPIDDFISAIVAAVRSHRAAVVTAAPGAGKTTRVPPALVGDGPVLLLQPRRVAARAIARRIAHERGWTIGREVGWHVRFDRQYSRDTQLIVATEGMLTARVQQDPLLTDFRTVIIDEFHERSIHADLGLALAKQAWRARDDLRLVIMSATIDAVRVAAFLDDCPVIDVPGRLFPLTISYAPGASPEQAIADTITRTRGALLCFLPGAGEIRRTADRLGGLIDSRIPVWPLHGGLDADAQDRAVAPSTEPRVILATNLAETTLTVPDVTSVVDTGWHRVARYDEERLVDSLETERIPQDAADQRAGRAGRTRAGIVVRLWDARDRLRAHREPEITRVDLGSVAMDVLAWGGDPRTLEWFEAPRADALAAAMTLLARLGAVDAHGRFTAAGHEMRRLPLHPRLARLLLSARAAPVAARACAWLSERHALPARHEATSCDLLATVEQARSLPPHVATVARRLRDEAAALLGPRASDVIDDESFRRAVLAGYPDRVARRRAIGSDRFVLASGTGARLGRESGVVDGEFIVAVDVATGTSVAGNEAIIRIATRIERDWLTASATEVVHTFDAEGGVVRAARVEHYDALVLSSHPEAPDPARAGEIIAVEYVRRGPTDADLQLLRRLAFAGIPVTFQELVGVAAAGARRLDDVDLQRHLASDVRRSLERLAPTEWPMPSGRPARLEYLDDGRVKASVRVQAVFGMADTPRLGPNRVPLTMELLAPSGRPVQVTSDLKSFWARGYPEVRKELRARYPKHRWPEIG